MNPNKVFAWRKFLLRNPIYLLPLVFLGSIAIGLGITANYARWVNDKGGDAAIAGIIFFSLSIWFSTFYLLSKSRRTVAGKERYKLNVVGSDAKSHLSRTILERISFLHNSIAEQSFHHRASFYATISFVAIALLFVGNTVVAFRSHSLAVDAGRVAIPVIVTLLSTIGSAVFLKFYSSTSVTLNSTRIRLDNLYANLMSLQFYTEETLKLSSIEAVDRLREVAIQAAIQNVFRDVRAPSQVVKGP